MRIGQKLQSRKFWLSCVILGIATALVILPLFGLPTILTGAMWVSVVGLVVGVYCGTNVWQHRVERDAGDNINVNIVKEEIQPNEEGEA